MSVARELRAEDCPWALYFQAVEMPKWSNFWYPVADSKVDWYVDEVHGRMDHDGIESQEAHVFVIAAQQALLQMIDRKDEFLTGETQAHPHLIYEGVVSGLQRMIALADREEVVFWTTGYEEDRQHLAEAMRRFHLGPNHPDYFAPPHRERRAREILWEINGQRKELRRRLETPGLGKELKCFLHEHKDWRGLPAAGRFCQKR